VEIQNDIALVMHFVFFLAEHMVYCNTSMSL